MTTAKNSASLHHRAGEILARSRRMCEPLLRDSVEALPDPLRLMAGYHFGWWDATGTPTRTRPGKALRPALTLCTAAAVGGVNAHARHAATAVELVHNFSLLHDDVMDVDRLRRGRPAVWATWGISDAILLGDSLHAQAARLLATSLPAAMAAAAVVRLEAAVIEMCRGQNEDCAFESSSRIDVDDYVHMAMGKTGALMGCACALGAMCAGADAATITAMDEFGRQLGLAFQFVDDVIGIWGDPARTGKSANDLARHKLSLPVVVALAMHNGAAAELADIYRHGPTSASIDVIRATALIDRVGARELTQQHADQRVRAAIDALPEKTSADDLMALAHLVKRRDR
ncbi:polyprenyl synthetase family protein [Nocardia sp. NBC_01009]|uniref:polyprenyl synthetase family protein n=1 Tax=Nocardia sp. NBC_01009 TaxID=2975996 RepID=UPI00386E5617|nr:polyprenyl synthetase family protein [Nocardia sp. NBC_01009]